MTDRLADCVPLLAFHANRLCGWRPAEFWAATPGELRILLVEPSYFDAVPLTRTQIETMMERDGHELCDG